VRARHIHTARLELVPLRIDDADEMVGVLGDPHLHAYTGGRPLSLDELRERYRRLLAGPPADGDAAWLNWIVRLRDGGHAVGTVQATVADDSTSAAVAWVVGIPWQRKGIASEAAIALVDWLLERGIEKISANIHASHLASQRVAARAGFARTDAQHDGEQVWKHRAGEAVD